MTDREKIFEQHLGLVYYVYNKRISYGMKKKFKSEKDDAIQEGKLAFIKVIDKWKNTGKSYDTPEFAAYAIKAIFYAFMDFYLYKTNPFKLTHIDYEEKNLQATSALLNTSFSLNQMIKSDGKSEEICNFLGGIEDNYDGIFYAELEKFLQLIPEGEREIMRHYYYSSIEMYEKPLIAMVETAKHFTISTLKLKSLADKWNKELYAFLYSDSAKGSLQGIHQRFENERQQAEIERSQEVKKDVGTQIRMIRNGIIRYVRESLIDQHIADGWQEVIVTNSGKKSSEKRWVNNGEVAFGVPEEDIQKFLDIGFVKGMGHVKKSSNSGKRIKISNGIRAVTIFENHLDYWTAIGYYPYSGNGLQEYVWLHRGSERTHIRKDEVEQYLAVGWHKGTGGIHLKICNIDGETKTILKNDLEKYLSQGWIPLGTSSEQKKKDRRDSNKVLINNGLIEVYIEKNKLKLFQSHGWKIGTVFIRVRNPNTKKRFCIRIGDLPEYLAKGYTLPESNQ